MAFLVSIPQMYQMLKEAVKEDYYKGRGRKKKYGDALIILVGVLITLHGKSYREAKNIVKRYLGMDIHISNIHYRLKDMGDLKEMVERVLGEYEILWE
ncbi:MAG: hypothetical protein ABDH28_03760 [Brevinematia bacterium]